jgi:hypothetical protein
MSLWSKETKKAGSEKTHMSPCGRYRLTIWEHETSKNTLNVTTGLVEEVGEQRPDEADQRYKYRIRVAQIERNYDYFPFCWLVRGEETFLFYGEDFQGYGCLKCSTGERADYLPVGYRSGGAFCWASIEPDSESENHLLVEGYIWGGPSYRMRYDVTNPFSFPYPEEYLGSAYDDDSDNEAEADS